MERLGRRIQNSWSRGRLSGKCLVLRNKSRLIPGGKDVVEAKMRKENPGSAAASYAAFLFFIHVMNLLLIIAFVRAVYFF